MTRRRLLGAAIAGLAGFGAALFRRTRRAGPSVLVSEQSVTYAGVLLFDGEEFLEGTRDVEVRSGRIEAIRPSTGATTHARRRGGMLLPGFVDAHVHLSLSDPSAVVRGGVTTVLDLGEPLDYAFAEHPPLQVRAAGPLITAPGGYPTRSWGANGYGLEVATPAHAREAVAMLAERGAAIIKVVIEPAGGPLLNDETLRALIDAAHSRRLAVAAHALGAEPVRSALDAGVDVLAHTPVEALPEALVRALGERRVAVISTLRAFGAGAAARENLANLAAAGCPVAYGTDLGNGSIRPGIDVVELGLLEEALGDRVRALRAATSSAGALAGSGGRLEPGRPAELVWVPKLDTLADLRRNADVLVGP